MTAIQFTSNFYDHEYVGTTKKGLTAIIAKADYLHNGLTNTGFFGMTEMITKPTPYIPGNLSMQLSRPHTGNRKTKKEILLLLQTHY